MQSKSIWRYIYFGSTLYYLQRPDQSYPIFRHLGVIDNINRFLERLNEFKLVVTLRGAKQLEEFRDELLAHKIDESVKKDEIPLTLTAASKLANIVTDIRKTLEAEAEGNIAFIITDKRLDVHKLLSDIRSLMAPGVYDALSDIAQYDFKEAGRCIAFELPTSAAFHLMRGTEAVLRAFYCSRVRRNRIKVLLWGPMVSALRNRRNPPEEVLLDNLDNIRRSFRNPTQHPEKIYDIQEVQDLFGLCIDVVNRMAHAKKAA